MTTSRELKRTLDLIRERNNREAASSLKCYLDAVVIDCVPEPQLYKTVREGWQDRRDSALIPAFEFVAGLNPTYTGNMNFYLGYGKGRDKTSGIGRFLNWSLAYAKRALRIYVGAKDLDQAAVLRDLMMKEASLPSNCWYFDRLDFSKKFIRGKVNGAEMHILACDPAGTQGKNPDILIYDELTAWDSEQFYSDLSSGAAKRGSAKDNRQFCLQMILTNAGYKDTWQDRIRQSVKAAAENGEGWYYYDEPEGVLTPSWMSKEAVDKLQLSKSEKDRLYYNRWIDLTVDRGAFSPTDINDCIGEVIQPPPGAKVYVGVDYGGTKDRTVMATVWWDGYTVQVAHVEVWQGSPVNEIKITEVDAYLDRLLAQYPNATVVFDPYQLVASIQRLESRGYAVRKFEAKAGKANYQMLESLRTLISNKKMRFTADCGRHPYDGTTLADELKRVIVKKMSYGFRLDHDYNEHDDRVVAVGMATLEAIANTDFISAPQKPKPESQVKVLRPVGGGFKDSLFAKRKWFGISPTR